MNSRFSVSAKLLLAAVVLLAGATEGRAQTFAPIPGLSFTKQFAGADPLSQTLTAQSTGASFSYTVAASTSSGGNWLSVDIGEGCFSSGSCSTPHALTVRVTPLITLAAGTYNGQIVFTASGGSLTMVVPVSLTVLPVSVPALDNLPGQVSFSLLTGGLPPPAQPISVRNAGPGTLNWTVGASTADGGNWLGVSAAGGTAPSTVNVTLNKANLPGAGLVAGSYIGQLVFSGGGSSVSVPVVVVVGANVPRQVNGLSFAKPFSGANPLPQTIAVASTGSAFSYLTSEQSANGGDWLTVSIGENCFSSGSCSTPHSVTVSITPPPTLPVGTYTGHVVLTATSGAWAMTVPVTLTVFPASSASFDNLPGQLRFSLLRGNTTLTNQEVDVRSLGTGLVSWTLGTSTADGGNWLGVSATAGTAPGRVVVSVSVANLPGAGLVNGTFPGQLLFRGPDGDITIPTVVTVSDTVLQQVQPLHFTKLFGGPDPLAQPIRVASTGASISFLTKATTGNGGGWLVAPIGDGCFSSGSCSTPHQIQAVVQSAPTLAVGTYTGQIVITPTSGEASMTIPVTLAVVSATTPYFGDAPGQLTYSMRTRGTVPAQTVQIRNGGGGQLDWTVDVSTSDASNWITVSSVSGIAPSSVRVGIDVSRLPNGGLIAGTFTGQLIFRSSSGNLTIPVSVVVGDNVLSQIQALHFTKVVGGANPLPQTVTVAGTGTAISYYTEPSTSTGGNWLGASIQDGCFSSGSCSTPHAATVSIIAPPTLGVGVYTGQVVFTQTNGASGLTVPVILTVSASGVPSLDNVPGEVTFALAPGGGNPAPQSIQVRNAGGGSLNWAVETSTSDNGAWLVVTPAGAGAGGSVTVSVDVTKLPGQGLIAGTFTGQILVAGNVAGSGSVTMPVRVTVATATFVQRPAMSFSKSFGGANPLPQVLNIASSGAAFFYYTQATTGNGGSWLSASIGSGCFSSGSCGTPHDTTVSITASPNLAAGTYTGQILLLSTEGSLTMTVPVTLTVGSVPVAPVLAAATPTASTSATQQFSLTARDTNGANDVNRIYFLVNSSTAVPANTCHGFYDRAGNTIWLYNDGLTALTSVTPGAAGTIQNSNCAISGTGSSVSSSGTDLTLTLGLTRQGSYASGALNVYAYIVDNGNLGTGWVTAASWTLNAQPIAPVLASLTPATAANAAAQTFAITARDGNGGTDVSRIYFLLNSDTSIPAGSCHGFYERATNTIFLYNDALSAVTTLTPGVAGSIQNSNCAINGAGSSASVSGTDLVLNLGVTRQGSYASGVRNLYVWIVDTGGLGTGWLQASSWPIGSNTPPVAPTLAAATPATAANAVAQTFALTARDGNGATDISRVYFLLNSDTSIPAGTCHGYFDRATNLIVLYNDNFSAVTSVAAGGAGSVQNSNCAINGAGSTASSVGTDLGLNLAMTRLGGYATGTRNLYVWIVDNGGQGTGWLQASGWTIGGSPVAPVLAAATPATVGNVTSQTFAITARDGNGAGDISRIYFLLNTNTGIPAGTCHGFYDRGTNAIVLYNDALSATSVVTPGVAGTIQNSNCAISGAASTVTASGTDLVLNLGLTRQGGYATGAKSLYVWIVDGANLGTGWVTASSWNIGSTPVAPVLAAVTPGNVGNVLTQVFSITAQDGNGATDVNRIYFLLNTDTSVPAGTCHGFYDRAANAIFLYNDGLTGLSSVTPGVAGSVQNSNCAISGGGSSVGVSGNDLLLNLSVTRQGAYANGTKSLYLWVTDSTGAGTGWVQGSIWVR